MRKIYYLGYYSGLENPNDFYEFPSSNSKMDYIISVIKRLNFDLTVFSLGFPIATSALLKKKKMIRLDEKTDFVFVSTIRLHFSFFSFFSKIWLYFQVMNLLLFTVKKDDLVLVYHSYLLSKVVNFCRRISKFKLVYEVEEIYQAAWQNTGDKIEKEINSLRNADGYILVNDLMYERFQLVDKPFVVCYGSYIPKDNSKIIEDADKVNLVYAGFIGGDNSDVALAIDTIQFLPDNYFLNVLGYGELKNIEKMKDRINLINSESAKEKVQYYGCLSGDEYYRFLKRCHIGLSTRVLIDEYSDYTFPSKVLVYLSNNIIPVSSKINCITKSKIAKSVVFYEENNPKEVAKSVLNLDINKYYAENIDVIYDLDIKFLLDFNNLILAIIN